MRLSAGDHRKGPRGRGSPVEALWGVWRPRLGLLRTAMDLIFFDFLESFTVGLEKIWVRSERSAGAFGRLAWTPGTIKYN